MEKNKNINNNEVSRVASGVILVGVGAFYYATWALSCPTGFNECALINGV